MSSNQNNSPKSTTNCQRSHLTLWHELDERQAEIISGGEGCLAWSIRFGDVTRPPRNKPTN